jgi:TetR/AcrR family transcriptional regulator, cholesterol catabolism regulator
MVQITPTSRGDERKREILRAAAEVFRRRGLHAAGMRDIAAELGMAVGNLYYYFESKQALLAFVQEDALDGLIDLADGTRSGAERADRRLFRLLAGHVVLLNESVPGSLAHLEVEALKGKHGAQIRERRRTYETAVQQIIADGVEAGVFRPVDPKVASYAMLGAVNWTVKWFRQGGNKSAGVIGRECAELLVRGLLARGVEPDFPPPSRGAEA